MHPLQRLRASVRMQPVFSMRNVDHRRRQNTHDRRDTEQEQGNSNLKRTDQQSPRRFRHPVVGLTVCTKVCGDPLRQLRPVVVMLTCRKNTADSKQEGKEGLRFMGSASRRGTCRVGRALRNVLDKPRNTAE